MAQQPARPTMTKTIAKMTRMQNSTMGNPRWRFDFTDGTRASTKTDTSMGYEVWSGWEGKTFTFTVDGKGHIWKAEEVKE